METDQVQFKNAWPYQRDKMNLPVADLEAAIPFYETILGFQVIARQDEPHKSATLRRDTIRIGLSENGGDPQQDGCFIEVDNVENALEELQGRGLNLEITDLKTQQHGGVSWKVFFVIAPDGLCYCLGQKQD